MYFENKNVKSNINLGYRLEGLRKIEEFKVLNNIDEFNN